MRSAATAVERIEHIDKGLTDDAQFGDGVEAADGGGLVVAQRLLCRLDFQPFILNQITYHTQFLNIFGRVQTRAAIAALGS